MAGERVNPLKVLACGMLAFGLAGTAAAQGKTPATKTKAAPAKTSEATYSDALACYQYYAVAAELARKLEKSDKSDADAAAGFQLQAITAKRVQNGWSLRIAEMGKLRGEKQISADLQKIGAPVIADANAALQGDKIAAQRTASRANACARLEAQAAMKAAQGG